MSIVNEFLAARAAFDAGNAESKETFDAAVQKARDAGYNVSIPDGDVSRAHISETGRVQPERVFVKDPAPASSRKRLFIKEKPSDDSTSSDEA